MLNENAKKWVAALRSGKYKQGTAFLNADDKLCCLGVACELAQDYGIELYVATTRGDYPSRQRAISYNGDRRVLPRPVADWLGLRHTNGSFGPQDMESLANENDKGRTFAEIADVIESEPKGLFTT